MVKWIPKRAKDDPSYRQLLSEYRTEYDLAMGEWRATTTALVASQREGLRLAAEVQRLGNRVAELTQLEDKTTKDMAKVADSPVRIEGEVEDGVAAEVKQAS